MRHIHLTPNNKSYIIRRYVDNIVSRMDTIDMWESLKDYLYREKSGYSIETLEDEINKHCPEVLDDNIAESVVGKGDEYAKDFY
jgi:hypothetical protein